MQKNIINLVIGCCLIFLSFYLISLTIFVSMTSSLDIVIVYGVLNIAGAIGTVLLLLYSVVVCIYKVVGRNPPNLNGDYVVYVILLIITPILTYITHIEIEENITGYVECKDQREFWSRYSSRTYAKTEELCFTIK